MLFNAARTYFPGILNDCYFDASTALCTRHQRGSTQLPEQPVVNRCQPALCRNSRVTEKHVPAIMTVIRDNRELLSVQKLSRHQRTALQENINAMEAMLAPLDGPA